MEDIAANKIEIFRPVTHSVDDAATQEENMEIMVFIITNQSQKSHLQ
jgi:hypothetical protein